MGYNLTAAKIKEFTEQFQLFDKNGDGTINACELGTVMKSLGLNPTEEDLDNMIKKADKNGSGSINLEEFLQLMARAVSASGGTDEMKQLFRVYDKDGNGLITASELRQAMASVGITLSEKEVKDMIRVADSDGDGQVNYEEFVKMMESK